MSFPAIDPIPLPAPIWLMKLLSHVTLALHFSAVMILVGCLLLVCWHNSAGHAKNSSDQVSASFVIARRMPVLMTFVINLGIPPLLFVQTLYGRAIYSSSVLIGVSWFSIILLVMLDYWLIYRIVAAIEAGLRALPIALFALLITMGIGQIYSMNMTLMLRPEVWREMYHHSASGLQGYHGDPTTNPRWMFVMCGGLVFGGLWALMLSNMGHIGDGIKKYLRTSGGRMAAVGAVLQIGCGLAVSHAQPDFVSDALSANMLAKIGGLLFAVAIAATALVAALQGLKAISNIPLAVTGLVSAFLATTGAVLYRDGIRDATLLHKGYNVWAQPVYANWSVLVLFLSLFVIMLGILFWLLMVMKKATAPNETITLIKTVEAGR
jgi:hypothetical protein